MLDLLCVKGVSPAFLFGVRNDGVFIPGLGDLFTPVSSGRVNINTATAETLLLFPAIDPADAQAIIDARNGYDQMSGTEDDQYFTGSPDVAARVPNLSPLARSFLASADSNRFISGISTVFEVSIDVEFSGYARRYVAWLRKEAGTTVILKLRRAE